MARRRTIQVDLRQYFCYRLLKKTAGTTFCCATSMMPYVFSLSFGIFQNQISQSISSACRDPAFQLIRLHRNISSLKFDFLTCGLVLPLFYHALPLRKRCQEQKCPQRACCGSPGADSIHRLKQQFSLNTVSSPFCIQGSAGTAHTPPADPPADASRFPAAAQAASRKRLLQCRR